MSGYTDYSIMPFGKYAGLPLSEVPCSYLLWYWNENEQDYISQSGYMRSSTARLLMQYIENNLQEIIEGSYLD